MKKILILFVLVIGVVIAKAQSPVNWTFSAKKVGDKTYELHLTATLQSGWHLYSQIQPEDAIAIPTDFKFTNNPLLRFDGKPREIGKLEKFKDDKLGISANQYSKKVDFVQIIKLKGNAKTNISGSLEYQTCDDKKCLPPKTVNFSVDLK